MKKQTKKYTLSSLSFRLELRPEYRNGGFGAADLLYKRFRFRRMGDSWELTDDLVNYCMVDVPPSIRLVHSLAPRYKCVKVIAAYVVEGVVPVQFFYASRRSDGLYLCDGVGPYRRVEGMPMVDSENEVDYFEWIAKMFNF